MSVSCVLVLSPSDTPKGKAFPDIGGKNKQADAERGGEAASKATGQKEGTGGGGAGRGPGGDSKMPRAPEIVSLILRWILCFLFVWFFVVVWVCGFENEY